MLTKNALSKLALGDSAESERKQNLHYLTKYIVGQCGLAFTNLSEKKFKEALKEFRTIEYAKADFVSPKTITIDRGLLKQFSWNMEATLRKLGMPVKMNNGDIELTKNHVACKKGEKINSQQAQILKLFLIKLAPFSIELVCKWRKNKFKSFVDEDELM